MRAKVRLLRAKGLLLRVKGLLLRAKVRLLRVKGLLLRAKVRLLRAKVRLVKVPLAWARPERARLERARPVLEARVPLALWPAPEASQVVRLARAPQAALRGWVARALAPARVAKRRNSLPQRFLSLDPPVSVRTAKVCRFQPRVEPLPLMAADRICISNSRRS
jgi:hypothetical protein